MACPQSSSHVKEPSSPTPHPSDNTDSGNDTLTALTGQQLAQDFLNSTGTNAFYRKNNVCHSGGHQQRHNDYPHDKNIQTKSDDVEYAADAEDEFDSRELSLSQRSVKLTRIRRESGGSDSGTDTLKSCDLKSIKAQIPKYADSQNLNVNDNYDSDFMSLKSADLSHNENVKTQGRFRLLSKFAKSGKKNVINPESKDETSPSCSHGLESDKGLTSPRAQKISKPLSTWRTIIKNKIMGRKQSVKTSKDEDITLHSSSATDNNTNAMNTRFEDTLVDQQFLTGSTEGIYRNRSSSFSSVKSYPDSPLTTEFIFQRKLSKRNSRTSLYSTKSDKCSSSTSSSRRRSLRYFRFSRSHSAVAMFGEQSYDIVKRRRRSNGVCDRVAKILFNNSDSDMTQITENIRSLLTSEPVQVLKSKASTILPNTNYNSDCSSEFISTNRKRTEIHLVEIDQKHEWLEQDEENLSTSVIESEEPTVYEDEDFRDGYDIFEHIQAEKTHDCESLPPPILAIGSADSDTMYSSQELEIRPHDDSSEPIIDNHNCPICRYRREFGVLPNQMRETLYNQDNDGDTLLHLAVIFKEKHLAKCLIEEALDPDALDQTNLDYGLTPLHLAIILGFPELIRYLLAHGAKPDVQDKAGNTALHLAAGRYDRSPNIILVKSLIAPLTCGLELFPHSQTHTLPQDYRIRNSEGRTVLHEAVEWDNYLAVSFLLGPYFNMDVNIIETTAGYTALHLAIANNNRDMAKQLILCPNINLTALSYNKCTPYKLAKSCHLIDIALLLHAHCSESDFVSETESCESEFDDSGLLSTIRYDGYQT